MKKILLSLAILAGVLALGVAFVTAESDNAAMVIRLDEGCTWWSGDLVAEGRVQYAETQNGKWTSACHGDIVEGLPLDHAVTVRSTADDPRGTCSTPFDTTADFHMTFSPSGKSYFICHGDLTP